MSGTIIIFQIIVLFFSAVIHEYMHGWMSDRLGDPTAKDAGRLTLNPLPHIDIIGTIMLPLILIATGSQVVFGWAKPVPFNPYNLRDQKYGAAKVALAGPLGNFITALFFGLTLRFFTGLPDQLGLLFQIIVYINILLMVFNLMPIPPLDGAKIIAPFLPYSWQERLAKLENYGMVFVILFIVIGSTLIYSLVSWIFYLLVGF